MVLLMTVVTYPPHKQLEVQKKFFETVKKYPYDESIAKRLVYLAIRTTKDGYEVVSIDDIPDGKFKEAINSAAASLHEYSGIEGYRSELRTYLSGEEAFKIIGKKLPE